MNRNEDGLLSHEETLALLKQAKAGDESAKETLYVRNIALVRSIVKRFVGRGVDYDDLYQLGCMGLVKAINNYDISFEVRFSTYAVPLIMGEIRRFLRDDGAVRVARPIKDLYAKAMATKEALSLQLGREPGVEEIAQALCCSAADISQAMDAARMPVSLYATVNDDGARELTLADCLDAGVDESKQTINRVLLQELLQSLPAQERQIILLRYFMEKTQSEIAQNLGISQVQVSRIESRIMKKLRESVCETKIKSG